MCQHLCPPLLFWQFTYLHSENADNGMAFLWYYLSKSPGGYPQGSSNYTLRSTVLPSLLDTTDQRDHKIIKSQTKSSVWDILYFASSHDNTFQTITSHLPFWPPIWLGPTDLGPSCLTEEMPFPVRWEDLQRWLVCSQMHASLGGLACQPWK